MTKANLSIVVAIVTGAKVSLCSFVLSPIFRGINDLLFMEDGKLNGTTHGPIWMVQIWLLTYHLKICDWRSFIQIQSNSPYSALIVNANPIIKSFKDWFSYFYNIVNDDNNVRPLLPPMIGPTWSKICFLLIIKAPTQLLLHRRLFLRHMT